jgi:hypothetical protein
MEMDSIWYHPRTSQDFSSKTAKILMTIIHVSHESNCVSEEYDKSGKNCILFIGLMEL